MQYSEAVLDHFHRPRNARALQDADLVGHSGTPGRGPFLVLYLALDEARTRVARAGFQTYGCAPAIACGSVLAERLPGATREGAARWDEPAIVAALGGLPDEKRHCSRLAAEALARALAAWGGVTNPPPRGDAACP